MLQLIQIRWNRIRKSLQLLSLDELDFIIDSICRLLVRLSVFLLFYCALLYDFNNNNSLIYYLLSTASYGVVLCSVALQSVSNVGILHISKLSFFLVTMERIY